MNSVFVLSNTKKPLMPCRPARARKLLADGINHSQNDPFFMDKGKIYLRYDKIEISKESPMEISVNFLFKGVCNYTLKTDADLLSGQTLAVDGIEGSIEVSLL